MEKLKLFLKKNIAFFGICCTVCAIYLYSSFKGYQIGDCEKVEKVTESSNTGSSNSGTTRSSGFSHK